MIELSDDVTTSPTPAVVPASSPQIRVVRVATLELLLEQAKPAAVLQQLASTDTHLTPIAAASEGIALISYRQERRTPSSEFGCKGVVVDDCDAFTIDGNALRDIVAQARRLAVSAIWMDVFCYRFTGKYNHLDFCKTLHTVLSSVIGVIWLPRSKLRFSQGQYPYRLWCTFEAACVEHRQLPVVVAGEGLSAFQIRLAWLGSYLPAAQGGDIGSLCRVNLFFYAGEVALAFFIVVMALMRRIDAAMLAIFYIFVINPLIWASLRSSLGQEVRLAKNAHRVLRTMGLAARRPWGVAHNTDDGDGGRAQPLDQHVVSAADLLRDLAWLPAFDRRDCLVVCELLGRIRPDLRPQPSFVHALAFSAHAAARLAQSDSDAGRLTLRSWLAERDIDIEEGVIFSLVSTEEPEVAVSSRRHSASRLASCTNVASSQILVSICRQSASSSSSSVHTIGWLDGGSSPDSSDLALRPPVEGRLPMAELHRTGWREQCGVTTSLVSPLGNLATRRPPIVGGWVVADARPTHRPRLGLPGVFIHAQICVLYPGLGLLNILRSPPTPVISRLAAGYVRTALFNISTALNTFFFLEVWRTDLLALCRQGITPSPFLVFGSARSDALIGLSIWGMVAAYAISTLDHWQSLAQRQRYQDETLEVDQKQKAGGRNEDEEEHHVAKVSIFVHFAWHLVFFVYMALVWTACSTATFVRYLKGYRSELSYLR